MSIEPIVGSGLECAINDNFITPMPKNGAVWYLDKISDENDYT